MHGSTKSQLVKVKELTKAGRPAKKQLNDNFVSSIFIQKGGCLTRTSGASIHQRFVAFRCLIIKKHNYINWTNEQTHSKDPPGAPDQRATGTEDPFVVMRQQCRPNESKGAEEKNSNSAFPTIIGTRKACKAVSSRPTYHAGIRR
ncbi:hypothetical protein CDAR_43711 [Caerostris darwini]|uniref:Uncharacterized protein n=1 Tax=Caerostris darwini TaxID=1538125 RepID=A0AAV4WGN7_9ARAC|nr:hypothetical protein CDAR_43711 [Caerostris darwini]